jgi:hypothetical protein
MSESIKIEIINMHRESLVDAMKAWRDLNISLAAMLEYGCIPVYEKDMQILLGYERMYELSS